MSLLLTDESFRSKISLVKTKEEIRMKDNEKKMIAILVVVTVVVIIIAIVMSNSGKNKQEETNTQTSKETGTTEMYDDGTKLNKSDKLHETKKLDGMEITNIQLTEKDGETMLIGTVNNNSTTEQGGYVALIKMLDKQGKEIATMEAYIGELKQGKSMKFSTSASFDSSNVYDFTITKK